MSSLLAVKPELPGPFPGIQSTWTCPITGLVVPKDPDKNLQWRAKLLREAESDLGLQQELYTASTLSILFWINTFVFTFRVFEASMDGSGKVIQARNQHIPFVTWDIQDKHILSIVKCIKNAESMLTDKSRDMGASWDHTVVFDHDYRFRPDSHFLEMSRVENDVDDPTNPKALFVKHDYIYKWLPSWMQESRYRTFMHIVNLSNGSRIDGESSNAAAGSGDRRRAVLMDEMAKMKNASKIKGSLRDVSPCLFPNSTPWGAGTAYSKWRKSGQIKVFQLPWYEHPEKGFGRYVEQDEDSGKFKIRSPWYNLQEDIRSPQEMAQEVDMDHLGSGSTFFEGDVLEQHKILFCRKPICRLNIAFKKGTSAEAIEEDIRRKSRANIRVARHDTGKLLIWNHLINGRLDQTRSYTLAQDISKGQGASNSVCSIMCNETREKVGVWVCAKTPPYEFASIVVALALWVGGRGRTLPKLVWEAQGPGWDFGRQIVKIYRYPIYYMDRAVGTVMEKRGKKYGWHSTREKKETMLGLYRRALAHGGYMNHEEEAVDEAATYIYYENGGIGPAELMEESSEARKTHGDRVIADMLCLLGVEEAPKTKYGQPSCPQRSPAFRKEEIMTRRKNARTGNTFNFGVKNVY